MHTMWKGIRNMNDTARQEASTVVPRFGGISPRYLAGLVIGCATVGFVIMASCKNVELASTWTTTPMHVDGRAQDWNGVTSHFLEESEATVAFANDSSQLYILMRTRDPRLASTIRSNGLMFWINADGKQEKQFVIRYRGGPTREEMRSMIGGERRRKIDREEQFMMPDTGKPALTCFVKGRIVEMEIPVDGSNGPAAAFSVDGSFFTYEFSLPLHESAVRSYGMAAVPGQTIRIGAIWGGSGRGMSHGRSGLGGGSPMGPPTGGGGGFGGGGGKGGGAGRRGDRSEKRPQPMPKQDIQMSLRLADSVAI